MAQTRNRLARIETAAAPRLKRLAEQATWSRDEDWVKLFAAWGRQGRFATEPDFPVALAFYTEAVRRSKAQADPPFDPPAYFMPGLLDQPGQRCSYWRSQLRFPEVHAGQEWLYEMLSRIEDGIPPVTEAEFGELARWVEANAARLRGLPVPPGLPLPWGGGRDWVRCLLVTVRQGARRKGAGELARALRALRAQHGDGA
jgi:hypothetical protein